MPNGTHIQNFGNMNINSDISNSFNTISELRGTELANDLKKLLEVVGTSGNQDAIVRAGEFSIELKKPNPSRGVLKAYFTEIVELVPKVTTAITAAGSLLTYINGA